MVVMKMTRLMRFDSGVAVATCAAIIYEEIGAYAGRMLMATCGVHVSDGSMKDFDLPVSVDVIGHGRVLLAWVWLLIVKICWCVDCLDL